MRSKSEVMAARQFTIVWPVILDPNDYDAWLEALTPPAELLRPFPAERTRATRVSTLVNSPKNYEPGCIEPLAALPGATP